MVREADLRVRLTRSEAWAALSREELREAGPPQAARFQWTETVTRTRAVYERVIRQTQPRILRDGEVHR